MPWKVMHELIKEEIMTRLINQEGPKGGQSANGIMGQESARRRSAVARSANRANRQVADRRSFFFFLEDLTKESARTKSKEK
jgi:hypothetical protein